MTQPNWKLVANLGDAAPIENGGAFVFIDTTGVYPPELEIWEDRPVEGSDDVCLVASRVVLNPHTHVNGVLSANAYHPDLAEWYAKDGRLEDVAAFADWEISDLVAAFCGRATLRPDDKDARDVAISRAQAYRDLVAYFGVFEFDQYPITHTTAECEDLLESWGFADLAR